MQDIRNRVLTLNGLHTTWEFGIWVTEHVLCRAGCRAGANMAQRMAFLAAAAALVSVLLCYAEAAVTIVRSPSMLHPHDAGSMCSMLACTPILGDLSFLLQ